ncbi:hypothetical protein JQC67_08950 [Aurantibacter crassamenti]|uniref:sialate O-acetylesterase n=1 Tax=Aurantibacter crassamenti TaxID=1837375 RepID=UPI00193A8210|nr:sialate O-acetylesterase [Aurantibacter crassamenti]MBM1106262.1 hypothetical protein [Aurantibacter crassamenti]
MQRDVEIPVWGFANPGEIITVRINSKAVTTVTNTSNKWMLKIPSMSAGGPYQMKIESDSDTIILRDIMIGEVWFASGQSNMEHPMGGWPWIPRSEIKNFEQELKDSDYPQIRMFNVPKLPSPVELDNLRSGNWELPSENTLPNFSATAWFFAKELYKSLNVPIGIIHSSWGGTAISPWMDRQSLQSFENSIVLPKIPLEYNEDKWVAQADNAWKQYIASRMMVSNSGLEQASKFSSSINDEKRWDSINHITGLGSISKKWIWLRKEIVVSNPEQSSKWCLSLGYLNRQAHVYLNGKEIDYFLYPKRVQAEFSSNLLQKGKNIILVRIAQPWGIPKVEGQEFYLKSLDGIQQLNLSEKWQILSPKETINDLAKVHSGSTSYLFNGMVAPIIPYAIRGFLWHQGSSDVGRSEYYKMAFPALIKGWRNRWKVADAPFIFVQLPNYEPSWQNPGISNTRAALRLAQSKALNLPNTSMVVSYDIGDPFDVHPANKQDFGYRLALQALSKVYKNNVIIESPKYMSHHVNGDTFIIRFDKDISNLRPFPNDNLCGFELTGSDGEFTEARAKIRKNEIYLTTEKVARPLEARYAWLDNPNCYLYYSEEIPMSPFWLNH